MYHCTRILKPSKVIKLWSYFMRALYNVLPKETNYQNLLKAACALSADERKGFVGVVTKNQNLEGFMIMENVSPIFHDETIFDCRLFWHKSGNNEATNALQNFFEEWAREQGVTKYAVSTHRITGAAIRCFQSEKFGFKRSHFVFTKSL